MPLIAGDQARYEALREAAQMIANRERMPIKVFRFTHKEFLEQIDPQ